MSTGGITFSGLATGLDTGQIISSLVAVERRKVAMVQVKQKDLESINSRLSAISSSLSNVNDAMQDLDSSSEILSSTATSSNSNITATVTGDPVLMSHSLSVASLATPEVTVSDTFNDSGTTGLFGTGTLSITVGAEAAVDISVDGTDTLTTVATKINESSASVSASVIYDGSNYRLQVVGDDPGTTNAASFSESGWAGTSLNLQDADNEIAEATDATFVLNGLTMTRSSNTVTQAIDGVTLELGAVTASGATIKIERDKEALNTKVQAFVDAYNDVISKINKEFTYTGTARVGDSLMGDGALRQIKLSLSNTVIEEIATGGDYKTLYSVGVRLTDLGTLTFNSSTLDSAVADDPDVIVKLFAGENSSALEGLAEKFDTLIEAYTKSGDGILTTKIDSNSDRVRGYDDQIDRLEEQIDDFEARLRAQFSSLEQAVSEMQNQGNSMLAALGQL
jgi:flagellar hook-associated protein 2